MDADFALAAAHLDPVRRRLGEMGFKIEDHPHSLNALRAGSQPPCEREFHGLVKYEPISRTHEALGQVLHVGRNDAAGVVCVMELADAAGEGEAIIESTRD